MRRAWILGVVLLGCRPTAFSQPPPGEDATRPVPADAPETSPEYPAPDELALTESHRRPPRTTDEQAALEIATGCLRRHSPGRSLNAIVDVDPARHRFELRDHLDAPASLLEGSNHYEHIPPKAAACFRESARKRLAASSTMLAYLEVEGLRVALLEPRGRGPGKLKISRSPVNAVLGNESYVARHGRPPTGPISETERIRTHLEYVADLLEHADTTHLEHYQLQNRSAALTELRRYARAGEFPQNNRPFPGQDRRPRFIDDRGVHCAVAQLIASSGRAQLAADIDRESEYAYVEDIDDPRLLDWAHHHGFERTELAMIQPSYWSAPSLPELGSIPASFRFTPDHFYAAIDRIDARACAQEVGLARDIALAITMGWKGRRTVLETDGGPPELGACIERNLARDLAPYLQPRYRPDIPRARVQARYSIEVVEATYIKQVATRTELEQRLRPELDRVFESCGVKDRADVYLHPDPSAEEGRFGLQVAIRARRPPDQCVRERLPGRHVDALFADRSPPTGNFNHTFSIEAKASPTNPRAEPIDQRRVKATLRKQVTRIYACFGPDARAPRTGEKLRYVIIDASADLSGKLTIEDVRFERKKGRVPRRCIEELADELRVSDLEGPARASYRFPLRVD